MRGAPVRIVENWLAKLVNSGQRTLTSGNPFLRYEYFVQAEDAYKQQKDERNGYQSRLPTGIQDRIVHLGSPRFFQCVEELPLFESIRLSAQY